MERYSMFFPSGKFLKASQLKAQPRKSNKLVNIKNVFLCKDIPQRYCKFSSRLLQ